MNDSAFSPSPSFADGLLPRSALRTAITDACRRPEAEMVAPLLELARVPAAWSANVQALATRLAQGLRERKRAGGREGLVQGLLQEYALSSREGVALMCLAEALLRIPDAATRDDLIRDKISRGDWATHLGQSQSLFVNAATWGLLLSGKLVDTHSESGLSLSLGGLIRRGGEPLIRKGVDLAMRLMGEQFVTGETIAQALAHAQSQEAKGFRYSYDMLGEAALTADDARRYRSAYVDAIHAIGRASAGRGVYEGPGISIKLSALHPRYSRAQYGRVMSELYPVVLELALLAREYRIGLNIDAEEADRLELSLDLLERLCFEPALAGFEGIGFVVQAYQKRCPYVIDALIDLARRSGHRLMVRLVKGAYWDSEIKRAQVDGLADYPVYTRKAYTDLSYLACARRLLGAPDAVYPQFATHNAHTLAAIYHWADPATWYPGQYEFQCLHGMGEPLYEQVVGSGVGQLQRPCRIYAPVGTHETLLAYLVRRLLENGANTSFVHRMADPGVAIADLVEDPVTTVDRYALAEGTVGQSHPAIGLPAALYGEKRRNSQGLDLASDTVLECISQALEAGRRQVWSAAPLLADSVATNSSGEPLLNPADAQDRVGVVWPARTTDVAAALASADRFAPQWAATTPTARAAALEGAANAMQQQLLALTSLLMREAGKTAANAVSEVREAIDFLRYYAAQARHSFDNANHVPLGPVVCISPWNFPLAIFTGQVAAALAAGNTVLAKPAEQTPLIAAQAVQLLWQAGVPRAAVQLLPGAGETVGAQLVGDPRVQGVMFTGSTEVARLLQRSLAERLGRNGGVVPLVAETGGQNAMVVDSSALLEQVVQDAVASAFDSAGQRCSALRVLCVQDDVADRLLAMLKGAMAELCIGRPDRLAVDVGPVIDVDARATIVRHIDAMRSRGHRVYQAARGADAGTSRGTFVPPTLIEIEDLAELQREVFGPVLHVLRYRRQDLAQLVQRINGTGYGLTFGVHTRIDETISQVTQAVHAGNIYVNRNMVGAVVGVQPFGGEGLSGTGPKAGGPLYLYRLLARAPQNALERAQDWYGGMAPTTQAVPEPLCDLQQWAADQARGPLALACQQLAQRCCRTGECNLPGPTGERNVYAWQPRQAVLCLAASDSDRLLQLAAVLAVGSQAVWPASAAPLRQVLPASVRDHVVLARDWTQPDVVFDAALHHGDAASLQAAARQLARRPGAIVSLQALEQGSLTGAMERLVRERSVSTNSAAAGGNASLMTLA